jgi:hypothetical protein
MECACSKVVHVEQSFHDDEFPSFARREAENLRDAGLCVSDYSPGLRRRVSRAQRSTLDQRQTSERPSRPTGRGKPELFASTDTRALKMLRRSAMSAAITSSVRESSRTEQR